MRTLLVTNDFPPKLGGIQSYLGELWRRLDPDSTVVLTASSHPDAAAFDAEQCTRGMRIERVAARTLYLPGPRARAAVDRVIRAVRPDLVLLDPFVPLGLLGSRVGVPYGVVLHGAEVAIPARLPVLRSVSSRVLTRATVVVSAGGYPEDEARRVVGGAMPPVVQVPPGVDVDRYVPLDESRRVAVRQRFGLPADGPLVTSVSRLVPRKGIDVLIQAAASMSTTHPTLTVCVAGDGRDRHRLVRLARRSRARVHFLGRVDDAAKVDLLGASDLFCQPCRTRWAGLEQEGFGIVFLEAAACGVAQVAGRSGGSAEAVVDGETGLVVDRPDDPRAVAAAVASLLGDDARRRAMGDAARGRAVAAFGYDLLAARLHDGLEAIMGGRAATS